MTFKVVNIDRENGTLTTAIDVPPFIGPDRQFLIILAEHLVWEFIEDRGLNLNFDYNEDQEDGDNDPDYSLTGPDYEDEFFDMDTFFSMKKIAYEAVKEFLIAKMLLPITRADKFTKS
jgi:hypothetical protein